MNQETANINHTSNLNQPIFVFQSVCIPSQLFKFQVDSPVNEKDREVKTD